MCPDRPPCFHRGYSGINNELSIVVPAPLGSIPEFLNRFNHPVNEQSLNNGSYRAEAAKIKADEVKTKIFRDKF